MDSILPEKDREFILRVVQQEGTKTRERVAELSERVGQLEARQSAAERTDVHLHGLILETSKAAGREGSESSGRKWSAINALIMLVATLIQSLIIGAQADSPKPAPAPQHTKGG